ncbi:MAG: radical SAM/SPASM domain-containing protein [bacterium]
MRKRVKHLTNLLRFNRGERVPTIGPLKAEWEVINTCNAKCQTCLHWKRKLDPSILSTSEGKELIRQLSNSGVLNLCFSGGEPLLRRDVVELVEFAKRNSLYTSLISNGLLITERRAKDLVEARLDTIFISIDAAEARLNDQIRGIPGYFELASAAIDNLKAMRRNAGPKIFIKTTLTIRNVNQLVPLAQLCNSKGIDGLSFQLAQKLTRTGFDFDEALLLKEPNYSLLVDQMDQVKAEFNRVLTGSLEYHQALRKFLQNANPFKEFRCISGYSFVSIDAWGNIFTSPSKNYKLGNIREQSFESIWHCKKANELREKQEIFEKSNYLFDSIGNMSVCLSDLNLRRILNLISPGFNGEEFN